MRTVKEVSKLTGVSVRTLHHYDAIGLLKPTKVTQAGYRLYDGTALDRLQQILLFRELRFPLKEIKAILDSPTFNPSEALAQQIELLELQYKHMGELISFAREIQKKGATTMEFNVFDKSEIEQYKAEVKARWGGTKEYQAFAQKQASGDGFNAAACRMMGLFAEFGPLQKLPPTAGAVQEKVRALRDFIERNFYPCPAPTLSGVGQLYIRDERFKRNLDQAGGAGTAEFVSRAIAAYCSKEQGQ